MKRKEFASSEESANDSTFSSEVLESDYGIIATHIFGYESVNTIFAHDSSDSQTTSKFILENTEAWILQVLERIEPTVASSEQDSRPGRLGNPKVRFDSTTQVGSLLMSQDRLQAQAQSNFSTVRANVCFYSGKWQYELQLESKGVMQLGWAMADEEFGPETGVGDSIHSFSYDGNRVRKWNLVTTEYGEPWQLGDIIGFTIDLDNGTMHFYRNGKDMGEAFSHLPLGPGCVFFPAVSLAFEEKVLANFGGAPFQYPVDGFQPPQLPPTGAVLRANQLLHWFYRAASLPHAKLSRGRGTVGQSYDAASLLFCEPLVSQLVGLISNPFIVEACVTPFLHDISSVSLDKKGLPPPRLPAKLHFFCDTLAVLLEPDDFKELINNICIDLTRKINQTSLSLEYKKQKHCLTILTNICQVSSIRTAFLKQPTFVKMRVPEIMDLKPIDILELKQFVSQPWWRSEEYKRGSPKHKEYETRKKQYFGDCMTIRAKTTELEELQQSLFLLFLTNADETVNEPSSRKHFLHSFRRFLKDNHVNGLVSFFLNNQTVEQTPLPVALNLFSRLLSVIQSLWVSELHDQPVAVPLEFFYSGEVDFLNLDRLGGVLSHLVHTFRPALTERLGPDHSVFNEPRQPTHPQIQVQLRGVDTTTGVMSTLTRWITVDPTSAAGAESVQEPGAYGSVSDEASLAELLDGTVLLYTVAAHKQLQKISLLRDDMDKYITALNDAKSRFDLTKDTCPEAAAQIEISIKAFEQKLSEQSRVLMAWVRSAIYTPEKRCALVWLLSAVLRTLEAASQQGDLFAFVPHYYLEALVQLSTALRNYFNPTLPLDTLEEYKRIFVHVAEFLVRHFSDPRIVNLGSKDTIIEALAGFVAKKQTLECLENISVQSQQQFVEHLLKPYDNRPWGQSNWILMRMWQGCGFAFRYQKSPHLSRKLGPRTPSSESGLLIHQAFEPCPSEQYQRLVAQALQADQERTAEFLNSLLKQLNWSFSEFISMMQEIQNLSKRPERVIIDARQLKICATCFDFVISLLRVLEMLCTICLQVFTDLTRESSENLLERLCQLLGQILLRVTSPTGCFSHVISLDVPDLDPIDQFPVLTAVVGVLMALLAEDIADKNNATMSVAAKSLLSEPAFQLDSLKYVLGLGPVANDKQDVFSFSNYPAAVSGSEQEAVSLLIAVLVRHQARLSTSKEVDDEELCPICCAMPLAVTFLPCHHRSCKSCITHHLMDRKECFFCKTDIKTVVGMDGKLLFDSTAAHKVASMEHSPI